MSGSIYICGMESEAKLIDRRGGADLILISAGDRAGLKRKFSDLELYDPAVSHYFDSVVSFGVCGALNPMMQTGQVARSVLGTPEIASTPLMKRWLFQQSNQCDAVDNETDIAKALAVQLNLPFVLQRVVLDTADQSLPPAALLPLNPDGTPNAIATAWSVIRHPMQIPALIRLATQQAKAFEVLKGFCGTQKT